MLCRPVEGLRTSNPGGSARPLRGSGFRPAGPQGHPTFRPPPPRRGGPSHALFIGQGRLRARMLMSGRRECGGRSGGGRPATRARVGGRRVGVAASMLLGCGSASHTRGARVLASSGGGGGRAASGARVCSGAESERGARRGGGGPGRGEPAWRCGAAAGRWGWGWGCCC
jgi:hypothetical protein